MLNHLDDLVVLPDGTSLRLGGSERSGGTPPYHRRSSESTRKWISGLALLDRILRSGETGHDAPSPEQHLLRYDLLEGDSALVIRMRALRSLPHGMKILVLGRRRRSLPDGSRRRGLADLRRRQTFPVCACSCTESHPASLHTRRPAPSSSIRLEQRRGYESEGSSGHQARSISPFSKGEAEPSSLRQNRSKLSGVFLQWRRSKRNREDVRTFWRASKGKSPAEASPSHWYWPPINSSSRPNRVSVTELEHTQPEKTHTPSSPATTGLPIGAATPRRAWRSHGLRRDDTETPPQFSASSPPTFMTDSFRTCSRGREGGAVRHRRRHHVVLSRVAPLHRLHRRSRACPGKFSRISSTSSSGTIVEPMFNIRVDPADGR